MDGIYLAGDDIASLMHTWEDERPWWRVDLEQIYHISAVKILNRAGKIMHKHNMLIESLYNCGYLTHAPFQNSLCMENF